MANKWNCYFSTILFENLLRIVNETQLDWRIKYCQLPPAIVLCNFEMWRCPVFAFCNIVNMTINSITNNGNVQYGMGWWSDDACLCMDMGDCFYCALITLLLFILVSITCNCTIQWLLCSLAPNEKTPLSTTTMAKIIISPSNLDVKPHVHRKHTYPTTHEGISCQPARVWWRHGQSVTFVDAFVLFVNFRVELSQVSFGARW